MTGEDTVQTRGDDAADHAPRAATPDATKPEPSAPQAQDAPNDHGAVDGGRAEPIETLNSANDA